MKLKITLVAIAAVALLSTLQPAGRADALTPAEPRAGKRPGAGATAFRTGRGLASFLPANESRAAYTPMQGIADADGGAESTPSPDAPTSSTGTNVQEAGIDEPDIVKSAPSSI